jgi:sodium/potassium/calcium exchanger 6
MYLGALLLLAPLSVQVHCDPGYIPNTLQASLEQQQQSSVNITECEFIQRQSDPCEFVRINCKQQDESGMFRYLEGYYCTFRPRQLSIIYIGMLFTLLAFLFLFIGTAAGDYFCPNLNTIANLLGKYHHM